ncbi:hypothetical protein [Shinella sp. BYT-45]|uniref:hypothetical protein n=1 Tax=Shinella sp. BYT-45 TaxID=3377377 RepID=UPI00397EDC3E
MADHSADRAWMTPLLNRIADVAGERAALTLAREKAGQQIYVPDTVGPDHWLVQMVGLEPALAMASTWGTQHITIPVALNGDRRRRAAAIAELIEKGYSNNQIVQMTGVSRRTVIDHRRKQPDDRQGSLF